MIALHARPTVVSLPLTPWSELSEGQRTTVEHDYVLHVQVGFMDGSWMDFQGPCSFCPFALSDQPTNQPILPASGYILVYARRRHSYVPTMYQYVDTYIDASQHIPLPAPCGSRGCARYPPPSPPSIGRHTWHEDGETCPPQYVFTSLPAPSD